MSYEQKPGTGTLFPNRSKRTDQDPDLRGAYTDNNGKIWDVAAWNRQGRQSGFLSFSISEPFSKAGRKAVIDEQPF